MSKTITIDLDDAIIIAGGCLPRNERKMRNADRRLVAAITRFKAAVVEGNLAAATAAAAPSLTESERALVDRNEIIPAIKSVRERLGFGLRDAKDLVDAYRNMPRARPLHGGFRATPVDRKLAIDVAREALGAVRVPTEDGPRDHPWAYFAEETRSWWSVTTDAMIKLADMLATANPRNRGEAIDHAVRIATLEAWAEADDTAIELDRALSRRLSREHRPGRVEDRRDRE